MARRKKNPDPPIDEDEHKDDEEGTESKLGHNGGPPALTDDQLQALFFQHLKKVRGLKQKIASLSGELRAAYKLAKAEIGKDARAMLQDGLALETDDGQAKMEEAIARQARVARWMATPLGAQADMFGDVLPAIDRARAAGKVARLQGEPLRPPHDPSVPQHNAWAEGWHEGEKALVEAQKRDDAALRLVLFTARAAA
jgi:hypothetical protein